MLLNCGVGEDLRVPWTGRSNQSMQKEINPEYSLEGLMLKLKLQYFGHLVRRTDSLEKTLLLGKIEGRKRRGRQRMRWWDGITDSMDISLSNSWRWWWTGRPGMLRGVTESDTTEWDGLNWMRLLTIRGSCHCCCLVAKSCPTLCDPMDCSPPGSSVPGKNTGMGCHLLLQGLLHQPAGSLPFSHQRNA